jgi:hypothetical protein
LIDFRKSQIPDHPSPHAARRISQAAVDGRLFLRLSVSPAHNKETGSGARRNFRRFLTTGEKNS